MTQNEAEYRKELEAVERRMDYTEGMLMIMRPIHLSNRFEKGCPFWKDL